MVITSTPAAASMPTPSGLELADALRYALDAQMDDPTDVDKMVGTSLSIAQLLVHIISIEDLLSMLWGRVKITPRRALGRALQSCASSADLYACCLDRCRCK